MNKTRVQKFKPTSVLHILLIVFLGLFCQVNLLAQQPSIQASLNSNQITIGDHVTLAINISGFEKGSEIIFPSVGNTQLPENIDVLGETFDTVFSDTKTIKSIQQKLTITAFAEGVYNLDFFLVQYIPAKADSTYTLQVPATTLTVKGVAVDTTKAIKDIKGLEIEPFSFKEILPYIAIALGVLLLAFVAWYCIRRYRNKQPLFVLSQPKPPTPPHIEALQNLDILKNEKLWQRGLEKEYYTQLTNIVRVYLEKQFLFPALEMTSDELLATLNRQKEITTESVQLLQSVLPIADLVKFAKLKPLPQEHDYCFNNIKLFVEQTAPKETLLSEDNNNKNEEHV